jgi:predicted dehydrogenase
MLDLCMFAEASRDQEEIAAVGDRGKVECGIPSSRLIVGKREPLEFSTEIIPIDQALLVAGQHHGSTFYQHQAFQACVRSGAPPEVSLADGRMAVAMGVAAERSIKTGEPLTF